MQDALHPLIGLGLRTPHYDQVLKEHPKVGWFEVHSENFFWKGGRSLDYLEGIAHDYPLSLHGVGLSLGSADGLDTRHLERLGALIHRIGPCYVSEHLSWGYVDGVYLPDLLPVPYTSESLDILARNVDAAQSFLKRELWLENPSSYVEYHASSQQEVDFLVTLCERTGAKILLDVNNVFVSACNHGWDALAYLEAIPNHLVKEIHLAGHSKRALDDTQMLCIDTHDQSVCEEVWELYGKAIQRFGPQPTLLEWDAQIPAFEALVQEAAKASSYLGFSVKEQAYA